MTANETGGASETDEFDAPWQAELIALQTALVEAGHLTRQEWALTLSGELGAEGAAEDGSDYYPRFLKALERVLESKRQAGKGEIDDLAAAWRRAAQATPHGQPILLANDPESCGDLMGDQAGGHA